jgi:hypothetical protein
MVTRVQFNKKFANQLQKTSSTGVGPPIDQKSKPLQKVKFPNWFSSESPNVKGLPNRDWQDLLTGTEMFKKQLQGTGRIPLAGLTDRHRNVRKAVTGYWQDSSLRLFLKTAHLRHRMELHQLAGVTTSWNFRTCGRVCT